MLTGAVDDCTWTSAAQMTFMRELYGQQCVKLRYNIMQKGLYQQLRNKPSSVKYKAFEIDETNSESKLKCSLKVILTSKTQVLV